MPGFLGHPIILLHPDPEETLSEPGIPYSYYWISHQTRHSNC